MDNGTLSYTDYGGEWTIAGAVEDHGTSHLSVVDAERNAVSFTTTINTSFGSKVISESTGRRLPQTICNLSCWHQYGKEQQCQCF